MDHNMPNIGSASNNREENPPPPPAQADNRRQIQQHEQYVPLANVTRIMRDQLPPGSKISDDSKEVMQACVSEFIHHLTGEANRKCHRESRVTVTPDDLRYAVAQLGFNGYVEPLSVWLDGIRAQERGGGAPMAPRMNVRARDGE